MVVKSKKKPVLGVTKGQTPKKKPGDPTRPVKDEAVKRQAVKSQAPSGLVTDDKAASGPALKRESAYGRAPKKPTKGSTHFNPKLAPTDLNPKLATANLVVGLIPVRAALIARGSKALWLKIATSRKPSPLLNEILLLAEKSGLTPRLVDRGHLDQLVSSLPHQGVVAAFPQENPLTFAASQELFQRPGPGLVLALDRVEDPHNLGALWRTGAAFGARALLVPKDRAASLTPTVYKVAAGGAEVTPLVTTVNLVRSLTALKDLDYWLVGAEGGQGSSLWSFSFPERAVLTLGSEGRGLSRLVKESMDFLTYIPLTGPISSLNVAAAGAILLNAYFKEWPTNQ
ncbi:MAG: RNA methyltransferase [Deltaproteobacteria bacterium]|nr:RNA methyltransferase [Deltaproteobacteria bacterium]